jgi:hypothetical protein
MSRKIYNIKQMGNIFFRFISPYLSYIDKGHLFLKPFSWLYAILAIANLLFPLFYIIGQIIETDLKITIAVLLAWVIVAFAGWLSFQLWWDRKAKITLSSDDNAEFVATPALSHLIQTFGEWIGTWIGLVGFGFALLTTDILGKQGQYLDYQYGIPIVGQYLRSGWTFVFLMPICGFLIIVLTRFIAEQIKALSTIANNTKQSRTNP